MGLMDSLLGAAGQAAMGALQNQGSGAQGPDGLAVVTGLLEQSGGLSGLLEQFKSHGLGEAAQSWVGTGANQAISADQVTSALGPQLQSLVSQLGGNAPQLAQLVAQFLPMVIDQLTPNGQLPANNGLGDLGSLAGLAGLASQFLKNR